MGSKKTENTNNIRPARRSKKETIKSAMAEGKPIVKSISFKEENYEELKFLLQQKNASDYICELIRRDRTIESVDNTPDLIKKAVQEQLANLIIAMPQGTGGLTPASNQFKEEEPEVDNDVLEDYFGDEDY